MIGGRNPSVLIIDGNGLVCKLWWASSHDVPNRFLCAIANERPNDCSVVVWWDSEKSWHRDLPARLKEELLICSHLSDRTQEEMRAGLEPMIHVRADGYKTDDLIATKCNRVCAERLFVVMMSDDFWKGT